MHSVIELGSLLSAVVGTVVGVRLWRRRTTSPMVVPLSLMMLGGSWWAVCQTLSWIAVDEALKTGLLYVMFAGVGLLVAASFAYFVVLAGHGRVLTPRVVGALAVEPVLLILFGVTDPWHGLFLWGTGYSGDGTFSLVPGPVYWMHIAYAYVLMLAGATLTVRAARYAVPGQRWVYAVALIGTLIPVAGNVVFNSVGAGSSTPDLTSVLFLVAAVLWLWVERSQTQLPLVPASANEVVAALGDAVMVVDDAGRLLALNPAADGLLADSVRGRSMIGTHWREVVAPELAAAFDDSGGRQQTVHRSDGSVLELRVAPLRARDGHVRGSVAVVRDVTELERLRAELAELAVRDGLTGLHNRRHLEGVLEGLVTACVGDGHPLAAVMVDLDHFKDVNDTHGHSVGDEVLIRVAELFSGSVREDDVAARFGGEEFVLLLPGATVEVAQARAEAWRLACSDLAVVSARGPVSVTLSCGVAVLPVGGTGQGLLHLADGAMYAAKAAGRDRVVVAGADVVRVADAVLVADAARGRG